AREYGCSLHVDFACPRSGERAHVCQFPGGQHFPAFQHKRFVGFAPCILSHYWTTEQECASGLVRHGVKPCRVGALNPPSSRSTSWAKRSGVRSSMYGPITCTPIGKPSMKRPVGTAVDGRSATTANAGH